MFWFLIGAAVYLFVGFLIAPSIARAQLEKLSHRQVTIQSGRLKGFSGIRLKGVVIADDNSLLKDATVLQADELEIYFNRWHLLRGRFTVRTVKIEDFLLTADYDSVDKKWELRDLFFRPKKSGRSDTTGGSDTTGKSAAAAKSVSIPQIILKEGALRLRDVGAEKTAVITTISLNGNIAEQTAKGQYMFSLKTDGRFGFGPSHLEGGLKMAKGNSEHVFWMTGQVRMPQSGIFQNTWDITDIHLECSFSDQSITVKRCDFAFGDGDVKLNAIMQRGGNKQMDLNLRWTDFAVSERFAANAIVYGQLRRHFPKPLNRFFRLYRPAGTANAEMRIQGSLKDLANVNLQGRIYCKDISILYENFPYRVNGMEGNIDFSGGGLELSLAGHHDDVRVKIDVEQDDISSPYGTDVRISSDNLAFDDDLYAATDTSIKKVWFDFKPVGRMAIDYRYKLLSKDDRKETIVMDLKDASAEYKYFPYPLDHLTGRIVVSSGILELKDVVADFDDGRQVRINGNVYELKKSDPVYHINIQGEKIPFDENFVLALPKQQQTFFKDLTIAAAANLDVDVFPNQITRQPDFIATMDVTGEALKLDAFPVAMTDIDASITVTQDVTRVHRFDAETENGRIHFSNSTLLPGGSDPNRPGLSLNIDLDHFNLNETFWAAAGDDAGRMLGKLRVYDVIDANGLLEINLPPRISQGNDLTVDCKNNVLRWDTVEIGRMEGQLTIRDSDLLFSDFSLTNVPLDALPASMMNERTQKIVAAAVPSGTAAIHIRDGFLRTSGQGSSLLDVHAAVDLKDLSFGQDKLLDRLDGACQGHFVFDFGANHWQTQAHYDIDRLCYKKCLVTGISGDLMTDPNTMQLESRNFTAQFYDGSITGNLKADTCNQDPPEYKLELNYDGINLKPLLVAVQQGDDADQAVEGTASGRMALTGNLFDPSQPRGKFNAIITDLEMGRQSLLGKILTAVQLKRPENFVFSEIDLNADVLGQELIFDRVRMIGNPLVFDGTGKMNLTARQMEMELTAWDRGLKGQENILDTIARGIGSALWKVEIHGEIDAPDVDAVYLSVLKQPLNIFKKNEE